MMGHYFLAQTASVNVGVNLGSGYLFMPKHALYGTQVGSSLQQMCGKGVTERMGTYGLGYSGFCGKFLDYVKHHYPGNGPAASFAQEYKTIGTGLDLYMATVLQVFLYFINGFSRNRDKTLFAALSGNPYEPFVKKKVLHLE